MVHRLFMDLENEPLVFTQSGRRKRIVDIYPREQGTAEAAHHADLDAAAQMEIFGRLFSWHRNTPVTCCNAATIRLTTYFLCEPA